MAGVAAGTIIAIEGPSFCFRFFRRAGILTEDASRAAYGQSGVGVFDAAALRGPGALALPDGLHRRENDYAMRLGHASSWACAIPDGRELVTGWTNGSERFLKKLTRFWIAAKHDERSIADGRNSIATATDS